MFWMRNKENNFPIRTLIWRPGSPVSKSYFVDNLFLMTQVLFSSGYHTISQRHDRPDDDDDIATTTPQDRTTTFSMPELMHNLNILVDMSEEDIVQNDRK